VKKTPATGDAKQAAAATRAYIAELPPPARRRMLQIARLIRAAVPGAVAHFSYRMPAFQLDGQPLVWYAAFKSHVGLYPIRKALLRKHEIYFAANEASKATLRLPLSKPLPVSLVKYLVRALAAVARGRAAAGSRKASR
jgi:uncharacterized protein YdhG (YjbR/CyaY superfamily)